MGDIEFITPRRIAAGFLHTGVLSAAKSDGEAHRDATVLFMWGSNRYNMLGANKASEPAVRICPEPTNITKCIPENLQFSHKYLYEVSCGGFHTVVLDKKPDADGGLVWVLGLANNGRLGVGDPEAHGELSKEDGVCWAPHPIQIEFP